MTDNFKLYSQYYDLLYQDKDYAQEVNYIVDLMNNYLPESKTVLELGAGTGKHAFLFGELGYEVYGIERSAEMVAIANQKTHPNVRFKVANVTDFTLDTSFDVATALFHVISYLTDTQKLMQTFANVSLHLKRDGLFIFDVWHSSAVIFQTPEKRVKKLSNQQVAVSREANPVSYPELNLVEVNYDITITNLTDGTTQQIFEKHPMRHFSKPEIEILASATGFELICAEEFQTKKPASKDTWGVCYVLKKR